MGRLRQGLMESTPEDREALARIEAIGSVAERPITEHQIFQEPAKRRDKFSVMRRIERLLAELSGRDRYCVRSWLRAELSLDLPAPPDGFGDPDKA